MLKSKKLATKIISVTLTVAMIASVAAVSMISPSAKCPYDPVNFYDGQTVKLGAGENYQLIVRNYESRPILFTPCCADEGCVKVSSVRNICNTYYGQIRADSYLPRNDSNGVIYVGHNTHSGNDYGYESYVHFRCYRAPDLIRINKSSVTMNRNSTYTVSESTNSGSYANASNLKWTSSNTSVLQVSKVDGTNKCTLRSTGKKGTAYVTVKTYNGKTAKCKVTVK